MQGGTFVRSETPLADVMNGKVGSSKTKAPHRNRKHHGELDEWEYVDLEYDEGSYDSEGELLERKPPKPFKMDEESTKNLQEFLRSRGTKTIRSDERPSASSSSSSSSSNRKRKNVFTALAPRSDSESLPTQQETKHQKNREKHEKQMAIEANSILRGMGYSMRTAGTHNGFSKRVCTPGTETYKMLFERAEAHRHVWNKGYEPYGGSMEKPDCLSYEHTRIAPFLAQFAIGTNCPALIDRLSQKCKDVLVPLPNSVESFRLHGNPFKAYPFWLPSHDGDYKFYVVFMSCPPSKSHIFMDHFYVNLAQ